MYVRSGGMYGTSVRCVRAGARNLCVRCTTCRYNPCTSCASHAPPVLVCALYMSWCYMTHHLMTHDLWWLISHISDIPPCMCGGGPCGHVVSFPSALCTLRLCTDWVSTCPASWPLQLGKVNWIAFCESVSKRVNSRPIWNWCFESFES